MDRDFTAEAQNRKWATDTNTDKYQFRQTLSLADIGYVQQRDNIKHNISQNPNLEQICTICWIKRLQSSTILTALHSTF